MNPPQFIVPPVVAVPQKDHHSIKPTPIGPNTDVTREKTVIKERELVRDGPGGHVQEVEKEEEIERDMVTQPVASVAGMSGPHPHALSTGYTAQTVIMKSTEVADASAVPVVASTKVNPRTGKPLTVPAPLPLTPRDMSPIDTPTMAAAPGQMIREEHEEVREN